ncbi:MAG: hypothetical protein M1818_007750 [Claussenomyces sp. TS43310]|nr:MAG: hypothetical protein M1818_007750 [Claussenomyces sp. TS43310]
MADVKPALSQNDKLVLGALFDHEGLASKGVSISTTSPSLPGVSPAILPELQRREAHAILPLNTEGPAREENEKAIAQLSNLIADFPTYASAWNNRAQAVRMLVGDDLTEEAAATSTLYDDLCEACRLAEPSAALGPEVSPLQAKILASAHTHRAHLLLKASRTLARVEEKRSRLPPGLRDVSGETMERMAARDFQMGGSYGNPIAKQMAVQLNPYAKLCGEIVKEAMIKDLRESFQASAILSQGKE